MKNNKRLEDILRERKLLLATKTLLVMETHNIISESRIIRKALRQSIQESSDLRRKRIS